MWVRPYAALSDGEKFRARLARGVALHAHSDAWGPLLCDDFCSGLHRRVARAISYGLRRLVTRRRLCAVVACSQSDLIVDLQPQTVVRLDGGGQCHVEARKVAGGRALSLRRCMRIRKGTKRDYDRFASMHYRATDELGFVDKVFVLRAPMDTATRWRKSPLPPLSAVPGVAQAGGRGSVNSGAHYDSGGEALGIVVYSYPPLELSLRNKATGGLFSRNPGLLNRDVRILRRLVVHPDVRGCGLGPYLVRKTLPLVGTAYVECLAAMGEFNPVFEKAGMQRIGQYDVPPKRRAALEKLHDMNVDPAARDFVVRVCREPRVRQIVARVVLEWYAATTGGGDRRVERQSPQVLAQTFRGIISLRPVYYLWRSAACGAGPGRRKEKRG